MSRGIVFFVSDDQEAVNNAKTYWANQGVTFQSYTTSQWHSSLESPVFRSQLTSMVTNLPHLNVGNSNLKSNILPFPGQANAVTSMPTPEAHVTNGSVTTMDFRSTSRVSTMDEIESQAIVSAIAQYKGNLTEAAKALGIGRATLYRKVKLYKIDPTEARRKKSAA